MALDPNIILRGTGVQPLDPVTTMTNALAVRGALENQRYAAEDRARTNALRQATVLKPDGKIDQAATLNNLRGLTTPAESQALQHQWTTDQLAADKAAADAQKAQFDAMTTKMQHVNNVLSSLGDNPPLEQLHQAVVALRSRGIEIDPQFLPKTQAEVPQAIQQARAEALGVEKTLANRRAEMETQKRLTQRQSEVGKILQDQADFEAAGGNWGAPPSPVNALAPGAPAAATPPGVEVKPFSKTTPNPDPNARTESIQATARNPFDVAVRNATQKPPEGFMWNENGTELVPIQAYWDKKRKAEGGSIKDANSMRDDFTKASKDFILTRDAYTRVKESARDPSAAGDLSLIFGFMRMLDPTSTVREGEFATAQNAAGVPDRIRNYYNRVMSGERLAPDQRADFVSRADGLYQGALRNHTKIEGQYTEIARRAGLDPRDVVISYREMTPDEPRTGADKPKSPPLTATNPKTGERIQSLDGGKTWQPIK